MTPDHSLGKAMGDQDIRGMDLKKCGKTEVEGVVLQEQAESQWVQWESTTGQHALSSGDLAVV